MKSETRTTILFWCQVSLYLFIMGAILTIVLLFAFWLNTLRFDLDENRSRDKAMLQQHTEAMQDHARARAQDALAFTHTVQAFDAILDNHKRFMHTLER